MKILDIGLKDYQSVYELQKSELQNVINGEEEKLIICSHDPVVTLGKKSTPQDICGWKGPVVEIERGGKATYHGPGQIIIYPIIDLKKRNQDISNFLIALESSMIETLSYYGLSAKGNDERGKPDYTGVWVDSKKIASIGVAVRRWVTWHGLAFNLYKDPNAFQGINPCGFSTDTMTSLENLLNEKVDRNDFVQKLSSVLIKKLNQLLI